MHVSQQWLWWIIKLLQEPPTKHKDLCTIWKKIVHVKDGNLFHPLRWNRCQVQPGGYASKLVIVIELGGCLTTPTYTYYQLCLHQCFRLWLYISVIRKEEVIVAWCEWMTCGLWITCCGVYLQFIQTYITGADWTPVKERTPSLLSTGRTCSRVREFELIYLDSQVFVQNRRKSKRKKNSTHTVVIIAFCTGLAHFKWVWANPPSHRLPTWICLWAGGAKTTVQYL